MEQNPQEIKNAKLQSQQSRFATLSKSHPHTDTHPKTHSISVKHPPPGEYPWQTAFACQNNFKKLNKLISFYLQLLKETF